MKDLLIADKADVLVAHDQADELELLINLLSPHYNVHPFTEGHALLHHVAAGRPVDLVLLDVNMPLLDGHQLCRQLTRFPEIQDVPIVFLSAHDSQENEANSLALGAVDYITKPFSPRIMLARLANHVTGGRVIRLMVNQNAQLDQRMAERTRQLAEQNMALQAALKQVAKTRDVTIMAFSSLAETRDNETGRHLRRTQNYIRELALALRSNPEYEAALSDETIELIYKSAPLHDIGKVAIPDHILLKNGRLEPAEFAIMKTHAEYGRRAIAMAEANLEGSDSFLQVAREIAYGHHEKWDGSGYPNGIAGRAIPLAARMMAVVDVYDALISRRVYKSAMSHDVAVGIIVDGRGSHFDPIMVDTFLAIQQRFLDIADRYRDTESFE